MSAAEYGLWCAEYRRSPWGEVRADVQHGIVAATVANVNRGPKTPAYKPTDFMPWRDEAEDENSAPEEDERDALFRMMSGG